MPNPNRSVMITFVIPAEMNPTKLASQIVDTRSVSPVVSSAADLLTYEIVDLPGVIFCSSQL